MQPWGGRIVSYDLGHGQDQQLGIEIDRDVRSRPSPSAPGGPSTRVYVVKPGDTLAAIARSEHVTLARLLGANPAIKNKNLIFPGQRIAVPN